MTVKPKLVDAPAARLPLPLGFTVITLLLDLLRGCHGEGTMV